MRAVTFGPPLFESPIGRVEPDAGVLFALLLFVSASDPRGVARDDIAAMLWPLATPEQARHSLRQALYRLRQLGMPIHLRAGLVSIAEEDTEIDIRDLLHGPIDRVELIRIGTQPFLPGYAPQLSDRYRNWVEELRDRSAGLRRRALAAAIVEARSQARFRDIHALGRALLALDPLNETATLAVAEALVMDGSKVEALQLLDAYEAEVGSVSDALRIPVRTLRRRVSEELDDGLMPTRFEIPFVGRVDEFRELREAVAATRRGVGQCVVITGEAGIGKTRTATELLRLAVLDGALVVTYTCGAGDSLAPLSSLLGLTGMLLSQRGALGCGQEHIAYLRRLLNPDPTQPLATGLTADLAYAQLVYSLSELVSAITHEAPLLIFVDDAHRLHETSWRIFTDVTHRLPERRVMLLLSARTLPDCYPTLGITHSDGRSRHVRLRPFATEDSFAFLDRWSDRNQVSLEDAELQRFTNAASGNPFYLGELAAHRARGGPDEVPPATIRGLIELQFASLREHAQRTLLVVSLLQAHATLDRIARVLELPPILFLAALNELELAGLITSRGTQTRLRHDIIAEVTHTYSMPGVLSFLRSRVARLLEADATGAEEAHLLLAAVEHWWSIGDIISGTSAALRAGNVLLRAGLPNEAAKTFGIVVDKRASTESSSQARLGQSRAFMAAGSFDDLARLDQQGVIGLTGPEGMELALNIAFGQNRVNRAIPDSGMLQQIILDASLPSDLRIASAFLAVVVWDDSHFQSPLPCDVTTLEDLCRVVGSPASDVLALVLAAIRKDVATVETACSSLMGRPAVPNGMSRIRILRNCAGALTRVGRCDVAVSYYQLACEEAARLSLPDVGSDALSAMHRIACHRGDASHALELVTRLRHLASEHSSRSEVRRNLLFALSQVCWLDRRPEIRSEAIELLERNTRELVFLAPPADRVALCFLADDQSSDDTLLSWIRTGAPEVLRRGALDHLAFRAATYLLRLGNPGEAEDFIERFLQEWRPESDRPASAIVATLPNSLAQALGHEHPTIMPRQLL